MENDQLAESSTLALSSATSRKEGEGDFEYRRAWRGYEFGALVDAFSQTLRRGNCAKKTMEPAAELPYGCDSAPLMRDILDGPTFVEPSELDASLDDPASFDSATDVYADYFAAASKKITDADSLAGFASALDLSDIEKPRIDAAWSVALEVSAGDGGVCYCTGLMGPTVGEGNNKLSVTLPVGNNRTNLYVVSGTVGSLTSATKIASSVSKGYQTFDLVSANVSSAVDCTPWYNAARDCDTRSSNPQTSDTQVAYIVAVSEDLEEVAKPVASEDLTYNGTEQVGVSEGEGYTLVGTTSATDAGIYEATATLKDGYSWSDSTTDPVTVCWTISKAKLTAKYAGETVVRGNAAQLVVSVDGFVGGDTAATAKGYKAPAVSAPESLEIGKSYELTPAGGEADNYY